MASYIQQNQHDKRFGSSVSKIYAVGMLFTTAACEMWRMKFVQITLKLLHGTNLDLSST